MVKPFFSIVIPTYNRCELLKATIAIILRQTFGDFELIVSDNASTDETEKVVKSFKDGRIRYFKNKTNIGPENNFQKGFSYAKGKYIFSMGDDDFILFNDTLERVETILQKEKFGFLRLNLIEKKFIGSGLRKSIINHEKNLEIKKSSAAERIIEFFNKVAVGHLAGLVVKNSQGLAEKFFDCSVLPWVKAIYEEIKKNGGYFLANHYMVITWSQGTILQHYDLLPNHRLMFEIYTDYIFSVIEKKTLDAYKLKYYSGYIKMQPVIKLYSSNSNLIKFDARLLQLEPRLKKNPFFWLMLIIALLMPKFIWEIVRVIQHKNKNTLDFLSDKDKIYKRFALLNNRYFSA